MMAFDLVFQPGTADDAPRANALSAEELRAIVETAGGALVGRSTGKQ